MTQNEFVDLGLRVASIMTAISCGDVEKGIRYLEQGHGPQSPTRPLFLAFLKTLNAMKPVVDQIANVTPDQLYGKN